MFTASRRLQFALSFITLLLNHSPLLLAQELREVSTLNDEQSRGNCFAAFTPDSKSLVSVDYYGVVNLWDLESKKSKQRWVNKAIDVRFPSLLHGAISPDGKLLATTVISGKEEDMGAIVFDLTTGTKNLRIGPVDKQNGLWPVTVAFSPDGKTVATGNTRGALYVFDLGTKKETEILKGGVPGDPWLRSLAFSADGKYLAAAVDGTDVRQAVVGVWDIAKQQNVASWDGQKKMTRCIAITKDGKTLATGSHDGTVKLWEAATGKEKHTLKVGGEVYSLALSPAGDLLAVGGYARGSDNDLHLFDLKSGKKLELKNAYHSGVTSVTFSPDGKLLATSSGSSSSSNAVKVWQVVSAKDKAK